MADKLTVNESLSVVSDPLRLHELYSPWNSPGQNTGVDSLSLLWGIFLTQVKPRSPALQADSLPVELPGKAIYVCTCVCVSFICICRVHRLHLVLAICLFWLKKDNFDYFCIPPIKMQIFLEVYFWTSQESVGTTDKHTKNPLRSYLWTSLVV